MMTDDLPLSPEARRIAFASASPRQVAQALAYATERLAAHFPTLDWPTWSEALQYVQPELVVQGPLVWLEWPVLARLVQRLASSRDYSVLNPLGCGPATDKAEQFTAYQDLMPLEGTPECSLLLSELAAMSAGGYATAAQVYAVAHEPATKEQNQPDPLELDQPPALAAPCSSATDSSAIGWLALQVVASVPALSPPTQTPARSGTTARRTFRDIVRQHPRANGKRGFTVRELCRAMRISAASLREAHANPGRLSLKAVSALADIMQEPLLPVLADLLAGAGTRKKRKNQ
jgi:hypothetical protein